MKKNKKAETLTWILVSVLILAMTIVGITYIAMTQKQSNSSFEKNIEENILKKNMENIIKNISLKNISWNKFYLSNDWNNINIETNSSFSKKNLSLENPDLNDLSDKFNVEINKLSNIEWIEITEIAVKKSN